MSHSVLRKLLGDIHNFPFLTIMVDETTDVSNKEQLTLVIRWVDENFEVNEEFLGLYNVLSMFFYVLRYPLLRYGGCSTMAGAANGQVSF